MAGGGDRPPRQPRAPEPLGREGRRPPGVERLDGVADDRAVVRVPGGAGPRLGQAARLARAARDQLPARAARAALPGDAAPVRRAAVLPLAREGPRPGRLLDRLGGDRGDGADLGRDRAPLRGGPLRRAGRRAPDRAARRRRARRGRVLGGDRGPDGRAPRRGAVDRRPQPPVARPRRPRHRGGPPRLDVRGGGLALRDGQARAEAGRAPGAAPARRRDAQRGVPAAAARRRERAAAAARDRRRRARRRRPARHLPRPRRPRPRDAAARLPRGRRRPRPPLGRVRLHDQGLAAADRGPPGEPLRAAQRGAVRAARGGARRRPGRPVGDVRGGQPGGGAVRGRRRGGSSARARTR